MPCVSVIIPVFNSSALIGTALQSVFTQTFQDFEVIVVDDGSEDVAELMAALSEWRGRIQYVRQINGGPASARNAGIARAAGELVAFLDADDEWLPEKLARQVAYFTRHPETGLLHTAVVGEPVQNAPTPGPPRQAFCDLYHTEFFINTLTVVVPRRVLEDVGGFDERREIHIEDWDLWLRIAARYALGYLDEPLAYHRPGGLMSRQMERTFEAQMFVVEKSADLCRSACAHHRANPAACDRARRYVLHRDWAYDRLKAGDWDGARAQLRHTLRLRPADLRSAALYASTFVDDAWRQRLRRLRGRHPDPDQPAPLAAPAAERARPQRTSLVHDTVYRRMRRRVIARVHDIEDGVWRQGHARKRILFEAASPMSFSLYRPIHQRLLRDPRLELWFTANGEVWQPSEIFARFGITERVVSPSTAAWMKVDAYVNADFWDMTWVHRRTRRVHLFHGVAGKYGLDAPVDLAPTIAAFDCLMFVNNDRRMRYVEAGLIPDEEVTAALVGYPKVDCLVDGSLDRETIRRGLDLDAGVSTVIYAPTWSPYSSLNTMGEEVIERLAAEGLQVIVKLHDRSFDCRQRGAGGIDWAARLARFDSHPRIRVVRDADATPFLAVSDAMVSDHSSIAFEYMLLDRPIVIVHRPELIREAAISADKVGRLRRAADVVSAPVELTRAITAALLAPKRLSAERRVNADQLFYRPGTATDRAVALLYKLIALPALADVSAAAPSTTALSAVG